MRDVLCLSSNCYENRAEVWKGPKGIPTKGIGKCIESQEIQGIFRVFPTCFHGILWVFHGVFRVLFSVALFGYSLRTLPKNGMDHYVARLGLTGKEEFAGRMSLWTPGLVDAQDASGFKKSLGQKSFGLILRSLFSSRIIAWVAHRAYNGYSEKFGKKW